MFDVSDEQESLTHQPLLLVESQLDETAISLLGCFHSLSLLLSSSHSVESSYNKETTTAAMINSSPSLVSIVLMCDYMYAQFLFMCITQKYMD